MSGAAVSLYRRAGPPFSIHSSSQFDEHLLARRREETHHLTDVGEKTGRVIVGNSDPPFSAPSFLPTAHPDGLRLAPMRAKPWLVTTAVRLVLHRGMQKRALPPRFVLLRTDNSAFVNFIFLKLPDSSFPACPAPPATVA